MCIRDSLWPELMGQTIANYTTEIVVRRQILYLTITSSSLKQELTYGKDKIIELINEELEEEYLKDVIIRWENSKSQENINENH